MAYETIGNYTNGLWLVKQGGGLSLRNRSHLPPEGNGIQFYWLGNNVKQIRERFMDATIKLGFLGQVEMPSPTEIAAVLTSGFMDLVKAGDFPLGPEGFPLVPIGIGPPAGGAASGGAAAGEGAAGGAAAGEGAAAGGAGAAAGGAAKSVGEKAVKAALGVAGALSISELLGKVGLWKGIGLTIAGAVLILIGILNLAGVDPSSVVKRVA